VNQVIQQPPLLPLHVVLSSFDDMIFQRLEHIQELLRAQRPTGQPVDVVFPSWGKLGWSGGRLVVIDDDLCADLTSMPRECRAEACLFLPKLVERMGL
jgi:hypothetical protein